MYIYIDKYVNIYLYVFKGGYYQLLYKIRKKERKARLCDSITFLMIGILVDWIVPQLLLFF